MAVTPNLGINIPSDADAADFAAEMDAIVNRIDAALPPDDIPANASRRTLGPGAQQAAPGNDARFGAPFGVTAAKAVGGDGTLGTWNPGPGALAQLPLNSIAAPAFDPAGLFNLGGGEWHYTAPSTGVYDVKGVLSGTYSGPALANAGIAVLAKVNSGGYDLLGEQAWDCPGGAVVTGSTLLHLNAGDVVTLWSVFYGSAFTLAAGGAQMSCVQVA
jgi:hypothetical protein